MAVDFADDTTSLENFNQSQCRIWRQSVIQSNDVRLAKYAQTWQQLGTDLSLWWRLKQCQDVWQEMPWLKESACDACRVVVNLGRLCYIDASPDNVDTVEFS